MKPENTLENKGKFFALYYGQVILSHNSWLDNKAHKLLNPDNCEDWRLQLKPLESISDRDAKYLGFPYNNSATINYIKSIGVELKDADWLRSKSYALPWMGLSVQELIEYGWIKLK